MEKNDKSLDREKVLKLQTYVGAEDKEKYLFLKKRLTAGSNIPDSQVLKLIINRLHALETDTNIFDASSLITYTRHIERRLHAMEMEMNILREAAGSKVPEPGSSNQLEKDDD